MRLIDFDSEIVRVLGFAIFFLISLVMLSIWGAKKRHQAREVIAVNGTETIACNSVWIVGRGVLGTEEHILHRGEWFVTSSKPIMIVSSNNKRKFLPENCRIIEE